MPNKLEAIEWTQYWSENCGADLPRILLIGDSISVGYRSPVYQRMKEKFNVTTVSTSKAIDNCHFLPEIRFLAEEEGFDYRAVHFNNGLHGWHLSTEEYRDCYRRAIEFLLEAFPGVPLILASSTPMTVGGHPEEFAERNALVLERNAVVAALAAEYSLPVDDLYGAAVGHTEYPSGDGVHFNGAGYEALADSVAASVNAALAANENAHE